MQKASFYPFKKKTCAPERVNTPGAVSRLSLQTAKGEHTLSLCRLERKTGSLTLSFFPVRSLFVIFPFLLTIASFRFVRFAHGANLRTLALSLRSNAVYATSFAPNSRKQRVIALFSAVWSERRDSNPQQPAWEAGILPLNYFRIKFLSIFSTP